MREIGIDISKHRSKSINEFMGEEFDIVATVCDSAREMCPTFPNAKRLIHRSFEDPGRVAGSEAEKLEAFRRVRDEIRRWILTEF
jgi:arsenate reductase